MLFNKYKSFPIWLLVALILMPFKGLAKKKSLKEKMYDFILSDTVGYPKKESTNDFPYTTSMKFYALDSNCNKVLIIANTSKLYRDFISQHMLDNSVFLHLAKRMMNGDTTIPISFFGNNYYNNIVSYEYYGQYYTDGEVRAVLYQGLKIFMNVYFSCDRFYRQSENKINYVLSELFDLNIALARNKNGIWEAIFFSAKQKRKLLGAPDRKRIYNDDGSLRCDINEWEKGIWLGPSVK